MENRRESASVPKMAILFGLVAIGVVLMIAKVLIPATGTDPVNVKLGGMERRTEALSQTGERLKAELDRETHAFDQLRARLLRLQDWERLGRPLVEGLRRAAKAKEGFVVPSSGVIIPAEKVGEILTAAEPILESIHRDICNLEPLIGANAEDWQVASQAQKRIGEILENQRLKSDLLKHKDSFLNISKAQMALIDELKSGEQELQALNHAYEKRKEALRSVDASMVTSPAKSSPKTDSTEAKNPFTELLDENTNKIPAAR